MSSQDRMIPYLPLEDDRDQAYAMSRPRKNYAVLLNDEKIPRSNRGLPGVVHVGGGCDLARCANVLSSSIMCSDLASALTLSSPGKACR